MSGLTPDLLVLLALWCYGLAALMLGWIMGQAFRDAKDADEAMESWHEA